MNSFADQFDPWGPVSSILYENNDSDFVQNAIANTGIDIEWSPFTKEDKYSHSTRIRALRRDISAAYADLDQNMKGIFAQSIVKSMLRQPDGDDLRAKLVDRLSDIGWTISQYGLLNTEDALVSEQFFPVNSEFDAYVTIREVFASASVEIVVVDTYISSSLLMTLKAMSKTELSVKVLTVEKNLKSDFSIELGRFKKQVAHVSIEVRTTTDFHDRFIVVDDKDFYHVGSSIKDAGKRAFMISRMRDHPSINNFRQSIHTAWIAGKPFCPQ